MDETQERPSYSELIQRGAQYQQYVGRTLLHLKSGDKYWVRHISIKESDLTVEFAYSPVNVMGLYLTRPIAELLDGRWKIL